jgi:threonine dehydrogenase-like Zn-dependent dehydrogenase
MAEDRIIRSLGVEAPGRAYHFSYGDGPTPEGFFKVETLYSGLSAGTELTFLKGTNPYLSSRWESQYGVFVDGEPSASFPVPFLGYMEVARVTESRAGAPREGDVVAMAYGHKSGHVADAAQDFHVVLPPGMDPMLGVFVAQMGPICANGLLHAAADLYGAQARGLGDGVVGQRVLVMGAGTVGMLTALFARRCGALDVLLVDPSPFRRSRAEALGFAALDAPDAWIHVKDRWFHGPAERGADVAFQCRATGGALHQCLKALRPQGTVIDLAFYQGGSEEVRLGEEFHHNGLAIRCAQIGRVPRGLAHAWNRRRLAAETLALLADEGDAIRRTLITHVEPFDAAPAFMERLVAERPDFLQVVFEFGR